MPAVAKLDLRDMDFDLDGFLNAGGKIHTYLVNSTTPQATYSEYTGVTANANPIVLNSSGEAHIFVVMDVSYKFIFMDADDVVLYTENGIRIDNPETVISPNTAYETGFYYLGGPPTTSQVMWAKDYTQAVTYPANWSGAFGSVRTNPTGSFVMTVQKNGATVGTITVSTGGIFTFATSAGAAVSFAAGDIQTVVGPSAVDATVAGVSASFLGEIAA